jgi:hypothetical protein
MGPPLAEAEHQRITARRGGWRAGDRGQAGGRPGETQERLPDPSTSAGLPGGVARIVQGIEPDSLLRLRRLHALLGAHRRTRAEGGEVRFAVTGPAVRRILAIMAIDRVIPVFGRPDEALTPSARSDLSG